ncbi:MAG: hypothetical protein LBC17_04055 [Lactobacillaceae bacterium]|nr:hypothetical protein [Lactobacillaceae bacterium]
MVIFKLIIGLGLFELILVIIAPALKLLGLSLYMSAIVLVTFHLIFITLFEFFDYFYNILNIFSNKISKVTKFIFMMFILLISSIHMIRTRFIVDFWIAKQNFKINQFIFLSMFLMIILMVIILLVQINNNYQEIINDKSKFINFVNLNSVPHKHIPVWFSAISIIRIKNFWSLFLSIILVLFIALYSSGIENTTQLFMLIFPLLGISWMYYADSTLNIRRMFQAYRITINDEIIGLLIIIFMISFPVLILGQEKLKNFDPFLYMVNVSIIGLISGFLFPKSKGNMNETISSILSLILIVMLTLIVNLNELLIPITVLSLSILYFVIKKESELKI